MPILRVNDYPGGFVWYDFCIWQGPNKVAEQFTALPFWFVFNGNSIFNSGHRYLWSCRVFVRGQWSQWFAPQWIFGIAWPSPAPTPLTPANGSRLTTLSPLLSVVPSMLGQRYTFQIMEVGSGRIIEKEGRTPFWLVPEGAGMLVRGGVYDWSCRVDNGTGWSNWYRPCWRFAIGNPADDNQQAGQADQLTFACRIHPNPFGDQTTVSYSLPRTADVKVTFYTTTGRRIREFTLGSQTPGPYQLTWNGTDGQNRRLPAGVYVCRLQAGEMEKVERIIRTQ